jgi:hypothetical protein
MDGWCCILMEDVPHTGQAVYGPRPWIVEEALLEVVGLLFGIKY